MRTKPFNLRIRTAAFARKALDLSRQIPAGHELGAIRRQFIRAATSVGSNYRAALRANPRGDFVFKLPIVAEGLLADLFVARRRRCSGIDSSWLRDLASPDPQQTGVYL